MHRSENATAILGMDGFVVGAWAETAGELWLMVETAADLEPPTGRFPAPSLLFCHRTADVLTGPVHLVL